MLVLVISLLLPLLLRIREMLRFTWSTVPTCLTVQRYSFTLFFWYARWCCFVNRFNLFSLMVMNQCNAFDQPSATLTTKCDHSFFALLCQSWLWQVCVIDEKKRTTSKLWLPCFYLINKRLLAFKDFKDKGTDKDRDKDKDKGHIINIKW